MTDAVSGKASRWLLDEQRPGTPGQLSDVEVERVLTMTLKSNDSIDSGRNHAHPAPSDSGSIVTVWTRKRYALVIQAHAVRPLTSYCSRKRTSSARESSASNDFRKSGRPRPSPHSASRMIELMKFVWSDANARVPQSLPGGVMIKEIETIYEGGLTRPVEPLELPEGSRQNAIVITHEDIGLNRNSILYSDKAYY